jgi:hypothetical protein
MREHGMPPHALGWVGYGLRYAAVAIDGGKFTIAKRDIPCGGLGQITA